MQTKQKTESVFDESMKNLNAPAENIPVSLSLEKNICTMDSLFENVDTLVSRRFENVLEKEISFCIYFSDGVSDSRLINEDIMKPLLLSDKLMPGAGIFDAVKSHFLFVNEIIEATNMKEIIEAVTYGDTILFIEGSSKAVIMNSKLFTTRAVNEPETEKVLLGPREGFNESLMTNLSMLRRRLRTNLLKMQMMNIGRKSTTNICVCYLDTIVNKKILAELLRRLEKIDIDAILDSNYISEFITESSFLAIPTSGHTERPDIAAAKLLEGRIAVFVDGSPVVLTLPYLFLENFHSNEDYYMNHLYTTFSRILRMFSFFLTLSIPAIFISAVAFHHEILPTALMIHFSSERMNVPLPAAAECLIMQICFDLLREAGVRMPSQVGQALSIVGALVIGQAGVEAKLVASPMIIVVALTGITGLTVPKLSPTSIVCRYSFLLFSSYFGLYGFMIGFSFFFTHLLSLKSIGVPILSVPSRLRYQDIKDSVIRSSWSKMLTRYAPLTDNLVRAKSERSAEDGGVPS